MARGLRLAPAVLTEPKNGYSPPCPTAKAAAHLSSSTLRLSSLTRSLSALSVLPTTCRRTSSITSATSSSTVASEVLCGNSNSLFNARKSQVGASWRRHHTPVLSQARPCSAVVGRPQPTAKCLLHHCSFPSPQQDTGGKEHHQENWWIKTA